jgi:periplasmic divalent cation tolerance protein
MNTETIQHVTVFVTSPPEKAAEMAGVLVQDRLAACVNIIPAVRSIYSWKGEVCDEGEALMVIKTRADLIDPLRERVVELHPYDVPEVIAIPIVSGHAPYLKWIDESTRS